MRIIGGNLKGRSLEFLKSDSTRPLKDSVKENIFNILTHSNKIDVKIEKADVLDCLNRMGLPFDTLCLFLVDGVIPMNLKRAF